MNSMAAFARGEASRSKELKVFDWDKAAQIIKDRGAKNASAGLSEDWDWTGGSILVDGRIPKDAYTFLASTWATPELQIEDEDVIDCYKMKSETPDWGSDTFWPDSAKEILFGKGIEQEDDE